MSDFKISETFRILLAHRTNATPMTAPNADRWKMLAGQLRFNAVWCAMSLMWFGIYLGAAMWRARDPFYPLQLIFWGFATVVNFWRTLVYLSQLRYSVPLALANEKGKEARSLVPYILGTALTCFCFALCFLAIKPFGRLCAVGAVALAVLTVLVIWSTEGKIKNVARAFYPPADESRI
jgi:hypothetical protein